MAIQSITTLPALAVTVGSAQLRGEIELGPSWPDAQGNIYKEHLHKEMWQEGYMHGATALVDTTTYTYLVYMDAQEVWGSGDPDVATWVTMEKVDLTNVNSIKLCSTFTAEDFEGWTDFIGSVQVLDVSSLSGEYFVRLHYKGHMMGMRTGYLVASTEQYGDQDTFDAIFSWGAASSTYVGRIWLE